MSLEGATPGARTDADHAGEDPGQVALIGETADQRHIRERQAAIAQFLLGHLDAARQQPVVRRHPHGAAERPREMAHRQAALPSRATGFVETQRTKQTTLERAIAFLFLYRPPNVLNH